MLSEFTRLEGLENLEQPKKRKCLGPSCTKEFLTTKAIRLCNRCKNLITKYSSSIGGGETYYHKLDKTYGR